MGSRHTFPMMYAKPVVVLKIKKADKTVDGGIGQQRSSNGQYTRARSKRSRHHEWN